MEPPIKRHIDVLDPVRGIAILLVCVYHSLGNAFGGHDQLPWGRWFRDFNVSRAFLLLLPTTFGWAGVAMFFVVSGFCIHLSHSRHPQWSLFLQRRLFRIYPPYLVALLFFALAFPITRLQFASWDDAGQFLSHLGLFHNVGEGWFFGINASFWSIAVEVQLYALYPLLLTLAARFGWRRSLIGIVTTEITLRLIDGILVTAAGGSQLPIGGSGLPQWLSGSPFFYWCSWSLGAFLAECHLRGEHLLTPRMFLYALGAAAVCSNFVKPLASMSFLLFALLTTLVIARLLHESDQQVPVQGALRSLLQQVGLWSFSLYLVHQPLLSAVPRIVAHITSGSDIHPFVLFISCIVSLVLIAPLARFFYHYCELPSIALGKRFHAQNVLSDGALQQTASAVTAYAPPPSPAESRAQPANLQSGTNGTEMIERP